jgi:ABC-type lipoprotein export system ATPase subunit
MIDLQNLTRIHHQGSRQVPVLRDVTFAVPDGQFVTLVGPSGAGKTTLLHILGLLDTPTSGTYRLGGEDVSRLSERERTAYHRDTIGFVFQAYHLIDDLTVAENIEAPLRYGKVPRSERQARVAEMLDRFGLAARADLFPTQLSGGQQQLVGVARALVIRPRLVLADEPTGNLHARDGQAVMDALAELHRDGVTVMHVTHNPAWEAYGERTITLEDGRLVQDEAVSTAVRDAV